MVPKTLISEVKDKVHLALSNVQLSRVDPSSPMFLTIFASQSMPVGVLWQPQGPIQWLHLSHVLHKTTISFYNAVAGLITSG